MHFGKKAPRRGKEGGVWIHIMEGKKEGLEEEEEEPRSERFGPSIYDTSRN